MNRKLPASYMEHEPQPMPEIIIDDEFKTLIPPLSGAELEQLHKSLTANGCRDPLVVWKRHNILLDGHNRYAFCKKHDIPFKVSTISTSNRNTAKNFIILNQLGRRNLAPDAAANLRGKLYNGRKKPIGGRGPEKLDQSEPASTAEAVAKETGVSVATVKRDAKYAQAVEKLGIEADVMSGKEKRSRKQIVEEANRGKPKKKNTRKGQKAEPYQRVVRLFAKLEFNQMKKAIKQIDEIWSSI